MNSHKIFAGEEYHDHFDPMQYLTLKEKYWEEDRQFNELLFGLAQKGKISDGGRLLELGGGPCINRLIPLIKLSSEIVFAEYTESSRKEVQKWLDKDPDAYDWSRHFKYIAELQKNGNTWQDLEEEMRQKMKDVIFGDVLQENPLAPKEYPPFDTILTASVLEAACSDNQSYEHCVKILASLLKPGGVVIQWGRLGGSFYKVGNKKFYAIDVDEEFVTSAFEKAGFEINEKIRVNEGDKTVLDLNQNKNLADASCRMLLIAKKK
ncbi:indolethylamine N-methyltransferase-like [Glandiceps talaboti]